MLLQLIKKDILLTWKYLLLMGALCCFYPFLYTVRYQARPQPLPEPWPLS